MQGALQSTQTEFFHETGVRDVSNAKDNARLTRSRGVLSS